MFGKQFFPTPEDLAFEMCDKALIQVNENVLDPSAGKGDLLLAAQKYEPTCTTYYSEIDSQLALLCDAISLSIGTDTMQLTFEQLVGIQVVLMNPPFRHAREHILHIWSIAAPGTRIVALRNADNITNDVRSEKELQVLIDTYGESTSVGSRFINSERSTPVKVEMIYLLKPEAEKSDYDGYEDYFSMEEEELHSDESGLPMQKNEIFEIVSRYVSALKAYDKLYDQAEIVNSYANVFSNTRIKVILSDDDKTKSINAYKEELQFAAWQSVFRKMNMDKYLTEKLRSETKHYHDNRFMIEGWKTNDSYLVGKKFIFPYLVESKWSNNNEMTYVVSSHNQSTIGELIRFLDYFTGYIAPVATEEELKAHHGRNPHERPYNFIGDWITQHNASFGKWYDFYGYFEAKGFKKGTMHFRWKDENLWARFNQHICKIKGFVLPEIIK